ncbi:hypothetical protein KBC55_01365 [Patescibacteria group bacterium]|nr:hypothetical protein [Patescibacteria group bacterium]
MTTPKELAHLLAHSKMATAEKEYWAELVPLLPKKMREEFAGFLTAEEAERRRFAARLKSEVAKSRDQKKIEELRQKLREE